MLEVKLTKNKTIPFINTGTVEVPNWVRVDKSTIFDLVMNPQSESQDYICYETAVEEISSYQPELDQEIAMNEGNPCYDFMFERFYNMPVGAEATLPVLICFAGSGKLAWLVNEAVALLGSMNTVEGKLTFTLQLGGDIKRGTYALDASNKPTFTETTTTE